jgi:late competence protein required for DNA uptake (superfamily II DNA/RNA helicase)
MKEKILRCPFRLIARNRSRYTTPRCGKSSALEFNKTLRCYYCRSCFRRWSAAEAAYFNRDAAETKAAA